MNMDSLIVPQDQLSGVVKALEGCVPEDTERAIQWLKAMLRLCPPCNRAVAEATSEMLVALTEAVHLLTHFVNDDLWEAGHDFEEAEIALAGFGTVLAKVGEVVQNVEA